MAVIRRASEESLRELDADATARSANFRSQLAYQEKFLSAGIEGLTSLRKTYERDLRQLRDRYDSALQQKDIEIDGLRVRSEVAIAATHAIRSEMDERLSQLETRFEEQRAQLIETYGSMLEQKDARLQHLKMIDERAAREQRELLELKESQLAEARSLYDEQVQQFESTVQQHARERLREAEARAAELREELLRKDERITELEVRAESAEKLVELLQFDRGARDHEQSQDNLTWWGRRRKS